MQAKTMYLEKLRRTPEPRRFVTFDIESKFNDTQRAGFTRPFLVGFYDGENFVTFRNEPEVDKLPWYERANAPGGCLDKVLRHIFGEIDGGRFTNRYKDCDVYAHNLGGFDGLFIPAWLSKHSRRYSYRIVPVQSRIQVLEVWRHNPSRPRKTFEERRKADKDDRKASGVWRFLDSFRVMPISLDEMAKTFGHGGKVEHDLHLPETDPLWEKYLRGDCEKLYFSLRDYTALIREMGGDVGITAPATAMKMLRMRFMDEDLKIHRHVHFPSCPFAKDEEEKMTDEQLKEIQKNKEQGAAKVCEGCAHTYFRAAYHGGRTEIYRRCGWGWYYDVNSSYPYSMKNLMPAGDITVLGENEDFTSFVQSDTHVGFVRCTVEIPKYDPSTEMGKRTYLPPLPVQLDGKLKFPTGRFSGTWDWIELQVLKMIGGKILHVEKSAWIRGKNFLAGFVDTLYALRDKNMPGFDPGKGQTAKIMLNSTFGKFGMDQDRQEIIILKPGEPEPWDVRFPGESTDQHKQRKELEKAGAWKETLQKKKLKKQLDADRQAELEKVRIEQAGGVWRVPEMPVGSGIYEHESLVRFRDTHVDAPYIIPQIAAHITALSRMLLWHYSYQITQKGYLIFYSDTDSILTDYPDIPDSSKLGGLKKEFDGEKVYVYCYAPKMYYLEKATPFEKEHEKIRKPDPITGRDEYEVTCESTCPGCLKETVEKNGKKKEVYIAGKHVLDEMGNPKCKKNCPGCAKWKIMMKGIPKDMRNPETIKRLREGETLEISLLEKLGAIARRGLTDTPRMNTVKKSLKSQYDKRYWIDDTDNSDTIPVHIDGLEHLSEDYKTAVLNPNYVCPPWLDDVLPEMPIHPTPDGKHPII
jgi:hypothetical protein